MKTQARTVQRIGQPSPSDCINLHVKAVNSLKHCMAELESGGVNYTAACRHLEDASKRLNSLRSVQVKEPNCGE